MRPVFKWTLRLLGAFVLLLAVVVAYAAATARVRVTAHGVHQRFGVSSIAFPIYSGTGDRVSMPGFLDGPVVRRSADGGWSATWFCEDRAHRATGRGDLLRIDCAGRAHAFLLAPVAVPATQAPMPADVVVLSDIEGNAAFLEAALRRLAVVDARGDWRFGAGHVVILGDSVDRGRDVFAVLWRLHGLAAQAGAAGGAVHVLLGNHEQYLLRGNVSRANPEHLYALRAMGGQAGAFAADTVIGAWLREQPVVLRLGDVLFVHGGVGPEAVASGLSADRLNDAMRAYWRAPATRHVPTPALDAVIGQSGLTQYRGYLMPLEDYYPMATAADVDRALRHFGVRQIVVAHSEVPAVRHLWGGKVVAVDVNGEGAAPQVLTYRNGAARIVDIGLPRHPATPPAGRVRDLAITDPADRAAVAAAVREMRRLAALPHPY